MKNRIGDSRIIGLDTRGGEYYGWALTTEFLSEKRGLKFVEIPSNSMVYEDACGRIMA